MGQESRFRLTPTDRERLLNRSIEDMRDGNRMTKGYVYLMTDASGLYKIGHTVNVRSRLNIFLMGNPTITLLHCFHTQERSRTEGLLHIKYADKRVAGEWFALNREDVEFIASMKGTREEYEMLRSLYYRDTMDSAK